MRALSCGGWAVKPRALDLYCCAGGASAGLVSAGFDVVGVDIEEQPQYPWTFVRGDALQVALDGFDLIWASPPCQRFSKATKRWGETEQHPDLIQATRERLQASGALYIIENVEGAPLLGNPVVLCGSMFGLGVQRHRIFEVNFPVRQPACDHEGQGAVVGVYGHSGGSSKRDGIKFGGVETWRHGMGIWWMSGDKLAQAIPPAYAEFLGLQARVHLMAKTRAA